MNDEQKKVVAGWFAAGASLDELQKRIKSEFGIHMTYLDVRLMVAELPQPVEDAPEEVVPDPAVDEAARAEAPLEGDPSDEMPAPSDTDMHAASAQDAPGEGVPSAGEVEVSVDALMIPGTLASGDVTFSDGTKGKWYLDQTGRLGLGDLPAGYRPNPADGAVFQSKLMSALQAKGLC